jgi:ribonuclease G
MTRQNVTDGVREIMTRPCPTCDGEGVIKSEETIAIELERKLVELAKERSKPEAFLIQANPRVSGELTGNGGRTLKALEDETGKRFHFEGSEGLPLDHFDVIMEGTVSEVEERALPFARGDEVLVHIVEPHMYAEDDAVAKIDGYIISVAGGGDHVGEKRLVRIEDVGRTSANAVLVEAKNGDDEPLQSTSSRRRGRRGGRRRSRATADSS